MSRLELIVAGAPALDVVRFETEEALSTPFKLVVWARGLDASLDLGAIVDHPASFRVETGTPFSPLGGARAWTGVVTHAEQEHGGGAGELSTYRFVVEPDLSRLRHGRDHRMFQDVTVPRLIRWVLGDRGTREAESRGSGGGAPIESAPARWNVDEDPYPLLETRVQYGESDLDFVQRLAEEAGIAYTFHADAHVTFDDALETRDLRAACPIVFRRGGHERAQESFTDLRVHRSTREQKITVRDYEFRRPDHPIEKSAGSGKRERFLHRPDQTLASLTRYEVGRAEDDRGAFRCAVREADDIAKRALHRGNADDRRISFTLNTVDLWPGAVFTVSGHGDVKDGERWLCTRFSVVGAPNEAFQVTGDAVSAKHPYEPPRRATRPIIDGVQSATVVGPPAEDIHTDEYGRVRVQFAWDRERRYDALSSGWMRVSQAWAGRGFGFIALPRVGQEVLVAFLGGNPDAPVVVGRLFNPQNPTPYVLPKDAPRSALRSHSSVASTGRNELMFDDAAGRELVYQQAERDLRRIAQHDEVVTVGVKREQFVGNDELDTTQGKRTEQTARDRFETTAGRKIVETKGDEGHRVAKELRQRVDRSQVVTIGKARHAITRGSKFEEIRGTSHLRTGGSQNEAVGFSSRTVGGSKPLGGEHIQVSKFLVKSGADTHIKTNTDLMFEAPEIVLKGPGGHIRLHAGGVEIQGSKIKINMGGVPGDAPLPTPGGAAPAREAKVDVPDRPTPVDATLDDGQQPQRQDVSPDVKILDATGMRDPLTAVPKGKTRQYVASGSPFGGKCSWQASGGVSIDGASDDVTVVVKGDATSSAVDEASLEVTYTTSGGTGTARIALTVFELTAIEASLPSTPSPSGAAPASARRSTSAESTLGADTTALVVGSGELSLEAITKPDGVPTTWDVVAASDDAGDAVMPTTLFGGAANLLRLIPDVAGSFHVRAYVDADRDGKWGEDDGGVVFDVHVVEAKIADARRHVFTSSEGFCERGSTRGTLGLTTGPGALRAEVAVELRGGGADGAGGVDKVVVGFVDNATGQTFVARYADEGVVTWEARRPYPLRIGGDGSAGGGGALVDGAHAALAGRARTLNGLADASLAVPRAHPVTGAALASIEGVERRSLYVVAFSRDFDENLTVLGAIPFWVDYGARAIDGVYVPEGAAVRARPRLATAPPARGEDAGVERHPVGVGGDPVVEAT